MRTRTESSNRTFSAGWLRGFWDGEGCVSFLRKEDGHRQTYCRMYVGNTDPSLIEACKIALSALGIEYSYRERPERKQRKLVGLIYISKHASLLRFARLVGFHSVVKTAQMARMVEYIETRGPKYPKSVMYDLYVRRKMSLPEISRHFGKHEKQQWYFSKLLRDYGIPTRSKSEAVKLAITKRGRSRSASSVHQNSEA